ncbi:MAG: tRNA epoxyqueuosine(34) reductase QueG, partial [Crocinitomicaceae bacterium]|nr:tRNA epoxyqueuosine(34) reductase QueG [Crocinitomicaceae bacterium]
MNFSERHTKQIKHKALELGFMYCGVSKADFLDEEAPSLENWLKNDRQGKMDYMTNHFDKN